MKKVTISLQDEEYSVLTKRIKEKKEFKNVEEYLKDIISQVVDRIKEESTEENLSKEDEEKVKERLRSLGYMD